MAGDVLISFDVFARINFASFTKGRWTKMPLIFWVVFDRSHSAKQVGARVHKICLRIF